MAKVAKETVKTATRRHTARSWQRGGTGTESPASRRRSPTRRGAAPWPANAPPAPPRLARRRTQAALQPNRCGGRSPVPRLLVACELPSLRQQQVIGERGDGGPEAGIGRGVHLASIRRNLRPLLHVLGFTAMLTATGTVVVLVHRHLSWPWPIPALFLHGTVFRTLQHSRHELSHRTVFRSRFLNELFLRLFSFLQWSSPDHFRASHVRHHQYTVHDELDREVQLPRPFQPLQWLFRFVAAVPNCVAEIKVLVRWSRGRLATEERADGAGVTWEQHCFADRPVGQGDAAKRRALFGWRAWCCWDICCWRSHSSPQAPGYCCWWLPSPAGWRPGSATCSWRPSMPACRQTRPTTACAAAP